MEYIFICKKCGNIQKYINDNGTKKMKCEKCFSEIGWENSFPPLTALNFKNSAILLLEQAKKQDKENLVMMQTVMKQAFKLEMDKTFIDKWLNKYEKWLEQYPDNDDSVWIERDDKFEDIICEELGTETGLSLFSAIKLNKNYYRKPYIIMIASLIEQLFNDFFKEVIKNNLSLYGQKRFLDKYSIAGIQSCIEILDSFFDESLSTKMNKYSEGFYDRWASLRNLRNDIIHSNSKYISKNKISKQNKLIEESFVVFANLKSEIYKLENNHGNLIEK